MDNDPVQSVIDAMVKSVQNRMFWCRIWLVLMFVNTIFQWTLFYFSQSTFSFICALIVSAVTGWMLWTYLDMRVIYERMMTDLRKTGAQ